jgi:glucose/mannose-6-phosphate isomerase
MAEKHEIPLFLLDYKAPPRAALGCLFVPLLGILQKLGLMHDFSDELDRMVKVLDSMTSRLSEDVLLLSNKAKDLSTQLFEKVPVIYGAGILSAVAHRWKTQLNENSKHWSFSEVLPDLNHNAVVGYDLPPKMKEIALVIILRSPSLHQRHLDRYRVTLELLEKANVKYSVVDAEGEDVLSQTMSLLFFGDWASYYLAVLNETDPTPVPPIDFLKNRLAML